MILTAGRMALVIAAAACVSAKGAVYFVSASGSDENDGLSPQQAWRSLARVNQAELDPGDYVLLRRGDVWTGRLIVPSSGFPDSPVTIGAYGLGVRPTIDGSADPNPAGLITIANRGGIVITGLSLRGSQKNGINLFQSADITIRDVEVEGSRQAGILVFDSERITIEDSEISGNALDRSASFDGLRIDGSGGRHLEEFVVRRCRIHGNRGGRDWNSGNGIFVGHTGSLPVIIRKVLVTDNDVFDNGDVRQNQAGRGITGTFDGDVTISGNRVYRNASAGLFIGDLGSRVDIRISGNTFTNNALRQFGGFTESTALADGNRVLVDDPAITAMGVEVGGGGSWRLDSNTFLYTTDSSDQFRGFVRIFTPAQDTKLQSDNNFFFSAGPRRWIRSDGVPLSFRQWQSTGHDLNSRSFE